MLAELAGGLAMAFDPALLMERAGHPPDPWQIGVLRSIAPRMLLNVTRQGGKSTTVAALVLHTALYQPKSLSLILSPGERQSKETFRKVLDVYHRLGRPIPAEAENKLELELENGSRVVALPGVEGTIRGYSGVNLLICDEASRIDDLLYAAVRPMLAVSQGRLIALSTPWGKRGWFYEAWEHGSDSWERVQVKATECPRISPAFLQEERETMGDLFYRSEYGCEFVDTEDQYFATEDIEAMMSSDFAPLFPISQEPTWTAL
jgi:hypothetical protein